MPRTQESDADTGVLPKPEERRTEHFLLLCEPGSFAARAVDALAARAEAAYQRGREWLRDGRRDGHQDRQSAPTITVHLATGRDGDGTSQDVDPARAVVTPDRDTIWVVVNPEQPGSGLELGVLTVLARASGVKAPVPGALAALAGLLAGCSGVGPSPDEADRLAHERHVVGSMPVRLFTANPAGTSTVASTASTATSARTTPPPADISFLSFVERSAGRAALARFARGIVVGDIAATTIATFGEPLSVVEAAWLDALRARFRGATTGQGVLRRALWLLRPHRLRGVELIALMAFDLVFSLAIPLSSKYLFDDVIARGAYDLLWIWLAAVLLIFAVGSVVSYRRIVVGSLIGELVLRDLRRTVFAQLQALSQRFHSRSSSGDLLSRIGNDLDNVQEAMGQALPVLLFQVISLLVGAAALLLLNWKLGLIVLLLSAPIFGVVYARATDRLGTAARDLQDRIGGFMEFVQENLAAQQLVKSYRLERRATTGFEVILAQLFDGSLRLIKTGAFLQSSSNMIFHGTRVVVLAGGAVLVLHGQMTVGELVAFVAMIVQVLQPVVAISERYQEVQAAAGAFDRVQEVLDEAPDVVEDPLATDLPDLQQEIRLDAVTFSYGDGQPSLHDVSLTIPAGSRIAIVGPSGAGKSTLLGLLLRLYDPDQGRLLFDGQDVREATLDSLRSQIAYVPQDTFLFNTTIAENIAVGREGASEDQVVRAAHAAALDRVIEQTEDGYRTVVGERGARLSGGQRQRLAIARALVRNPRVLILDEATSALDTETEAAIHQTLHEVGQGRTVVAITHRLSSVIDYDRIFVLDRGLLVEQGTHQELCERRGLYWRLYREQQGGATEPGAPSVEARRLARVPLFAALGPAELAALARQVHVERLTAGTAIVREGDLAEKLYVVAEGSVEVTVADCDGQPVRVNTLRARSYFGEIALLRTAPTRRMATVRSLTPVELYSLHRDDFHRVLCAHPRLAVAVTRLAMLRIRHAEARIEAGTCRAEQPLGGTR